MTIEATQKIIKFLDRYCDRTVSTGCDYYHLQIGGISCDYTLHVDGDDAWVEGSEEDLAILNQQS
jgi:hypothetical protein